MNATPNDGAILAYLRQTTRPAHDAIEGAMGVMDANLNLATYRNILQRLYGFWAGWQPQIAGVMQDELLLTPRRRLHLLAADLMALGMPPAALDDLPRCPAVGLQDTAAAMGSLYVMEGSSLGGRVISRHVAHRLGAEGRDACRYFQGYGPQTGTMWLSFLARLNAESAAHKEQIAAGALATFTALGAWMAPSS
jgi:heme oxygenase (biliverdin-IX-beta and delta-forming)